MDRVYGKNQNVHGQFVKRFVMKMTITFAPDGQGTCYPETEIDPNITSP